jgi:acyl-CoA thioesterase II
VVGDLETESAVEPVGAGRYEATLSAEWEIWGPMGGYVAAVALRAAGAESPFPRPASFSCQYLGVANFEPVDIAVVTVRQARTACAQRIELTQAGRPILDAAVWSVGAVDGLTHHVATPPAVPGPLDVPTIQELVPDEPAPYPFWSNVESRPLDFIHPWPPSEPLPPVWRQWMRLQPRATFEDPWTDAARSVILVDVQSWPAASRYHAWRQPPFIAPSLDLYVAFHEPTPDAAWLLADGVAPTAAAGLIGWTGRLWTEAGRLVASGGGQLLCRRLPPGS